MARARKTNSNTSAKTGPGKLKKFAARINNKFHTHQIVYSGLGTLVALTILLLALFIFKKDIFLAGKINGEFITTPRFYNQLVQANGEATFESLEREVLINQEAKKKGVSATKVEIDQKVKEIEDRFGGSDGLKQALEANNTTIEQVRDQLRLQVLLEKIFADDIKVTDADLASYKKENKDAVKGLSDDDIKQQIKSTKLNQKFSDWFDQARNNANIQKYFK